MATHNPLTEHVGAFMETYYGEVDLVRSALSCHFAVDVLCDKAEVHCPDAAPYGTIAFSEILRELSIVIVATHALL